MPQMTYFRRAALAGKSLKRASSAQLRGNLRRNDIDSNSAVPYFSGITNGQTLIVEGVDSGGAVAQATVGIPANPSNYAGIAAVVTALNAGLAAINVQAFDDGGCIGLRSMRAGALGRVRVVGGTAATALGFNVSAQSFFALSNDISSSIEGRGLGQPYGAALVVAGENLTSDAFVRALGRVMANTDVLYADLMRREVMPKKVGQVSAAGGPVSYVDLGAQKIFIGLNNPSKEDLAHLFFLVDQSTKQISHCRVTGITNASNVSILNQDQTVVAAQSITGILNGRVVFCPTGNFTGAGVQEGDFATISGAGNNDPFSNNGYRWVVEEIIDATHVALRPMSKVELAMIGSTIDENQPTVELNSAATGAWGSLTITRGVFSTNARLQISPPVPRGTVLDIWAAVGDSLRERPVSGAADRGYGVFAAHHADFDTAPNGLLTRPSITQGATTVAIGPFMARWHGRVVRIPGQTFTAGPGAASWFFYWDEADAQLKATTNPALVFVTEARDGSSSNEQNGYTPNTAGKGQLIASALVNISGTILQVTNTARVIADDSASFTVGHGGQFRYLEQALEYLRLLANSGQTWRRAEIVAISDLTAPVNGWTAPGIPLLIRGANPRIHLNHGATGALFNTGASDFILFSDVCIDFTKVLFTGAGGWQFRNVTDPNTGIIRTEDSPSTIDIGTSAPSVNLGKAGTPTNVRGRATVAEGVTVPAGQTVQVGATGTHPGARLDVSGTQGRVVLGKEGEAEVELTKDQVDVLKSGSTSDASGLHTHQNIVDSLAAEALARATADSNELNARTSADNGLQAQLSNKSDVTHLHDGRYALIGHTHPAQPVYARYMIPGRQYMSNLGPLRTTSVTWNGTAKTLDSEHEIQCVFDRWLPAVGGYDLYGVYYNWLYLDLFIAAFDSVLMWMITIDDKPLYYDFANSRFVWNGTYPSAEVDAYNHANPAGDSSQWPDGGDHHNPTSMFVGYFPPGASAFETMWSNHQWTGGGACGSSVYHSATRGPGTTVDSDGAWDGNSSVGRNRWIITPGVGGHNLKLWVGVLHTSYSGCGPGNAYLQASLPGTPPYAGWD